MPKYEYVGDSPRSIPALGLDVVPGQQFEVEEEIRHSDFVLVKDKKPSAKGADKEE
jgi:hypothetical protein